jgi:hypothetical protein
VGEGRLDRLPHDQRQVRDAGREARVPQGVRGPALPGPGHRFLRVAPPRGQEARPAVLHPPRRPPRCRPRRPAARLRRSLRGLARCGAASRQLHDHYDGSGGGYGVPARQVAGRPPGDGLGPLARPGLRRHRRPGGAARPGPGRRPRALPGRARGRRRSQPGPHPRRALRASRGHP